MSNDRFEQMNQMEAAEARQSAHTRAMYIPHVRSGAGGRQHVPAPFSPRLICILVVFTLLISTSARGVRVPYQEYNSPAFRRLAARGAIEIDRSDPPPRPAKRQRQVDQEAFASTATPLPTDSDSDSDLGAATTDGAAESTESASADQESTPTGNPTASIATASNSVGSSTALPSPFDTSLGTNFTSSSCPSFFDSFLNNASFEECHATSLMLQNSNSFFQASRSDERLAESLDAACAASLAQCSPLMASLASDLIQDSNCGQDYRRGNPIVGHARAGLIAYEPVYRATCLKSEETDQYCFVDAINNSSNLSDSYPYYLPLGTELPAASRPSCDQCLVDVMDIFAGYAAIEDQPISTTYTSAAQQINLGCGPDFINTTVPVASVSGAPSTQIHIIASPATFLLIVVALTIACLAL